MPKYENTKMRKDEGNRREKARRRERESSWGIAARKQIKVKYYEWTSECGDGGLGK